MFGCMDTSSGKWKCLGIRRRKLDGPTAPPRARLLTNATPTPTSGSRSPLPVRHDGDDRFVAAALHRPCLGLVDDLVALTIIDTNVHRNATANYRVTPLLTGTNWEGPYAEGSIDCGVGTLEDLQVVQHQRRWVGDRHRRQQLRRRLNTPTLSGQW
ncbi:MAG: hypothetical protein KDC46_05090 [Thermoleophilia bacterium]|nr:hypothetical protein [Thermoleophilia bacterium]